MNKTKKQIKKERKHLSLKQRFNAFIKSLKQRLEILFFNAWPLILFEIIFKALFGFAISPIVWLVATLNMKLTNFNYVIAENFGSFIQNPLSILMIVVIVLIIGFLCMLDISAAIFTFEVSRQRKKTNLKDIIVNSFWNTLKIFKPKNLAIILLIILFFPLLNIGTTSIVTHDFSIPSSWVESILLSASGKIIIVISLIVLIWLMFRWIFVVHYFTLENLSFFKALRKSSKVIRGNRIKNIISVLIIQAVVTLLNFLLLHSSTVLSDFAINIFGKESFVSSILISALIIGFSIAFVLLEGFFMPLSCWRVSMLFYENKKLCGEKINDLPYKEPVAKRKKKVYIILSIIFVIAVSITSIVVYSASNNMINETIKNGSNCKTIAYKDFSNNTQNYSIANISKASEIGASSIYFDLHKLKDNQIISYDYKGYIPTVSDSGKKIEDWTLEELNNSLKSQYYTNLLKTAKKNTEDVIEYIASNDITNQNIELPEDQKIVNITKILKAANLFEIDTLLNIDNLQEEDILTVYDEVCKNYSIEHCSFISLNLDKLRFLKNINSKISTVYRTEIAIGDLSSLDEIDGVAIEKYNVIESQVIELHNAKKLVFAWNINKKDQIDDVISENVDYIITNYIETSIESTQRKARPKFVDNIYKKIYDN